ncbi:hypothetical protein FKP32DRAFT_476080 [Trametes sanguinea]|nr:hypothetical protein FKP32DRAFT_476080 [Trametes sanguinea]
MQTGMPHDFPSPLDDWQELVTQIENLRPAGVGSATLTEQPYLSPIGEASGSKTPVPQPAIPPKSQRRAAHRSSALPPKVSKANSGTLRVSIKPFLTRDADADAHQRDAGRSRAKDKAPPTPTVTRHKPSPRPTLAPSRGRRRAASDAAAEASDSSPFETTVFVKPVPMDPTKRFSVDILPDWMHTTIWDGDHEGIYPWPCALIVTDYDPPAYFYRKHSIEDVSILFYTHWEPRGDPPTTTDPAERLWETAYTGHRIPPHDDLDNPPTLKLFQGIAVENDYQIMPRDDPDVPFQWLVRFWVPVPMTLFARAEHRTFVCEANVTMRDPDTPATEVVAERVVVGIERLQSERLLATPRRP